MKSLTQWVIACGLSIAAMAGNAGVGLVELPGLKGDGPVTVFYPSSDADLPVQRGVFELQLAFDMDSLARPRIPLGRVTAGKDTNQIPRFHSSAVLAACADRCTHIAHLSGASHGAMLSPMPPLHLLDNLALELLGDPPGFDRQGLRAVDAQMAAFFVQALAPHRGVRR